MARPLRLLQRHRALLLLQRPRRLLRLLQRPRLPRRRRAVVPLPAVDSARCLVGFWVVVVRLAGLVVVQVALGLCLVELEVRAVLEVLAVARVALLRCLVEVAVLAELAAPVVLVRSWEVLLKFDRGNKKIGHAVYVRKTWSVWAGGGVYVCVAARCVFCVL